MQWQSLRYPTDLAAAHSTTIEFSVNDSKVKGEGASALTRFHMDRSRTSAMQDKRNS
jgi:hypothetical protein